MGLAHARLKRKPLGAYGNNVEPEKRSVKIHKEYTELKVNDQMVAHATKFLVVR